MAQFLKRVSKPKTYVEELPGNCYLHDHCDSYIAEGGTNRSGHLPALRIKKQYQIEENYVEKFRQGYHQKHQQEQSV